MNNRLSTFHAVGMGGGGTGAPSFVGDVAITGGKISAVGPSLSVKGSNEIDATGLIVAPGFVDVHTHYGTMICQPFEMICMVTDPLCVFVRCASDVGSSAQPVRRRWCHHRDRW